MKILIAVIITLVVLNIATIGISTWYRQKQIDTLYKLIVEVESNVLHIGEYISPYGFGFYPKLPEQLPKRWAERYGIEMHEDVWPRFSPETEILLRIEIKLLSQGKKILDCVQSSGYIFPLYENTLYLKKRQTGYSYIGTPEAKKRFKPILDMLLSTRGRNIDITDVDLPDDLTVISYEEGSIDPYTFLNIPTSVGLPWRKK